MSQSPVKPITMKSVKLTYMATKTDIYKNENISNLVQKILINSIK